MANPQNLQPSDIYQRRLDVLGVVPNVDLSSNGSGAQYLVFSTGNIGYPSPSSRVYVAYMVVDFSNGAPTAAGACAVSFGVVNSIDWMGYGWSLRAADNIFAPPFVLSPTLNNQGSGLYNPPVYGKGQNFLATVASTLTPPISTRATFTAVGWAE